MRDDHEFEIVGQGSMNRVWVSGDTVRRERGPHSATVAELLHHLERRGFPYAPRHRGVDEHDRDILTRLPGRPVPTLRGDEQLHDVGVLLRDLHAAARDFRPPPDAAWRTASGVPGPGEIVVHSDVAPWNLLEQDGRITGLVDWDTARPGRPVEDLAYVAWHFTPLHGEPMGDGTAGPALADRPRRLRVLCDVYGLGAADRAELLSEVARMQVSHAAMVAENARHDAAMQRHWNGGRFTTAVARSLLWLDEHRDALEACLRR